MVRFQRHFWRFCSMVLLILALALSSLGRSLPVSASASAEASLPPAAAGAASLGGTSFVYARRPDNAIWVRSTDGLRYSDWNSIGGTTAAFPAAASTGSFISVFIKGPDGGLWTNRTGDGRSYEGWRALGGRIAAAPAAATLDNRLYVFTRGNDGDLAVRVSDDGRTFSAPHSLGGPLLAAPVATNVNGILTVFGKGPDGQLYTKETPDGRDWTGWRLRAGDLTLPHPLPGPEDGEDYPLALDVGINFISPHSWENYQLPAFAQLRPTLAKFSMFYDQNPTQSEFSTKDIDDVIALGARTVIFRTAETRIAPDDVERQLHAPLPGDGRSILDYVRDKAAAGSQVEFWIEVGNEPDLGGMSPWLTRYTLLATIRTIAPRYRATHPNLRWMASMPTRMGLARSRVDSYHGLSYLDIVLSDYGDGLGDVASQYDAIGVHLYGADTLQQSFPLQHEPIDRFDCGGGNGDANCPTVVLDRVLSKTSRPVFITEAGINSALPWAFKAKYYVDAMYRLPSQVRGFAIFTLSLDPEWYAGTSDYCSVPAGCSRYALDVSEYGVIDGDYSGAKGIGECYQRTIATQHTAASAERPLGSNCRPPCALSAPSAGDDLVGIGWTKGPIAPGPCDQSRGRSAGTPATPTTANGLPVPQADERRLFARRRLITTWYPLC